MLPLSVNKFWYFSASFNTSTLIALRYLLTFAFEMDIIFLHSKLKKVIQSCLRFHSHTDFNNGILASSKFSFLSLQMKCLCIRNGLKKNLTLQVKYLKGFKNARKNSNSGKAFLIVFLANNGLGGKEQERLLCTSKCLWSEYNILILVGFNLKSLYRFCPIPFLLCSS